MALQRDSEHNEIRQLQRMADLAGKRVLEIGVGEGRLTWRYARSAGSVAGIDPDLDALRVARVDRPAALEHHVSLAQARAQALPFPRETFERAILAWSL
jgi:ubiquinone/menaquinone biosynthesis C-methylase UbiE